MMCTARESSPKTATTGRTMVERELCDGSYSELCESEGRGEGNERVLRTDGSWLTLSEGREEGAAGERAQRNGEEGSDRSGGINGNKDRRCNAGRRGRAGGG